MNIGMVLSLFLSALYKDVSLIYAFAIYMCLNVFFLYMGLYVSMYVVHMQVVPTDFINVKFFQGI
jgi:hypothetical protein